MAEQFQFNDQWICTTTINIQQLKWVSYWLSSKNCLQKYFPACFSLVEMLLKIILFVNIKKDDQILFLFPLIRGVIIPIHDSRTHNTPVYIVSFEYVLERISNINRLIQMLA